VSNTENNTALDNEDAAWAAIQIPFKPSELLQFCHNDIERLFRINPYLEFNNWESLGNNTYRFSGKNISQEQAFDFDLKFVVEKNHNGLQVNYENGLKQQTIFAIEPSDYGARLTIRENYVPISEQELQQHQGEIDRSLTTWAGDIQKFLIMWKQWQWLAPWRWYMDTVWKKLKPSGRRITYMFWWITVVEVVLIALGAVIYFLEYA